MVKLYNLTKDKLISLYINDKKSLGDIAKLYIVSRTAVFKKLKKYGIAQRSKSYARIEAQKQGKVPQQFFDINENFFRSWSPEMAYVLGLIITDGCVSGAGQVSLSMNDQELLEKVKKVMGSEHNITPSKHQAGLYCFHFAREKLIEDLHKFGVFPRKSLTVNFPDVPQEFLTDFIRGVFDGDGSVYFEPRSLKNPLRSKFVSSSKQFIEGLHMAFESLRMPKRKIYQQKTKNAWSYSLVFCHRDSKRLFEILYKNTKNGLFLDRKYNKFIDGLKYSTKTKSYRPRVPAQKELKEFKRLHNFDFEYKISDLAKRLDVSRRTVERWLSCKNKPSAEKLKEIKRYLDEKRSG